MADTWLYLIPETLLAMGVLAAVTLTGAWLFLLGWRDMAKDPNARYGPAIGAALASVICFPFVAGISFVLFLAAESSILLGGLASLGIGLAATLALISGITRLKVSKAALASVPLLALPVLFAVFCVVAQAIKLHHNHNVSAEIVSAANLKTIHDGVLEYATELAASDYPPDLESLVELEHVPPHALKSPGLTGNRRGRDYFYLRPGDGLLGPAQALVACSYADCLKNQRRVVLRVSGETARLTREQFEAELTRPQNAAFAAALRAEEARLGIASP
ncbi:MAG: hypothetical protein ACYTFO_07940 [Planctomycetota bacterium]